MKILIVGGVAGGATAAARLRRLDEDAEIVLLERGMFISYANCGLPYYIGGEIADRSALTLQSPEGFSRRYRVDVRVSHEVTAIDPESKWADVVANGTTYRESYDKLLLSPGAKPVRPPIPGIEDPRIFTLRTIPDTLRIREYVEQNGPRRATIVGGGFIGLEMAENLTRLGIRVTLIEMANQVFAPFDPEMACDLHHYLRGMGVRLLLNSAVRGFETAGTLKVKTDMETIEADMVLFAAGVRPESGLAKMAGLQLNSRGYIQTNLYMQTSAPDIYAVGDAVEIRNLVTGAPAQIPLAGPANRQARIAADHICGIASSYGGAQGSSVLKLFDRTAAATGINEAAAKAYGINCDKVYTLSQSHASYYPGASAISIKLLFETATGKVLGAQLFGGDGVDKRCDVIATAIRAGMTVADLTDLELCYAPPYSSAKDPVNMAGYVAENVLAGRVRQYHWDAVDSLPRDGSATLLDVRTSGEYARGHIAGTVHIPLDSLREHLDELDRDKPVYVNCQSGLRSYLACRILTQRGFECYNLAGGYRLYESVTADRVEQRRTYPCGMQE